MSPTPISPQPASWLPGPTGRHDHRYWDGATWTDNVSDNGVPGTDPYTAPPPPPPPPPAPEPASATRAAAEGAPATEQPADPSLQALAPPDPGTALWAASFPFSPSLSAQVRQLALDIIVLARTIAAYPNRADAIQMRLRALQKAKSSYTAAAELAQTITRCQRQLRPTPAAPALLNEEREPTTRSE